MELRSSSLAEKFMESQNNIDLIYQEYSETQQEFRLFSVNVSLTLYQKYAKELQDFKNLVDSIVNRRIHYIQSNELGFIGIEHHKNVLSTYIILNNDIDSVINYAKHIEKFLKSQNHPIIYTPQIKQIIEHNYDLLYDLNKVMIKLNKDRFEVRKEVSKNEKKVLFEDAKKFKNITLLSIFFMFILICVIIYYQFFTTVYISKLNNEKIYANKLADKNANILSQITHEIRTPINALIGILDLIKKNISFNEQKDKILVESAYTNIINTSKTINDILELQTFDPEDSKLTHFDVKEMLIEAIKLYDSQAKIKTIELKYEYADGEPTVIFSDQLKIKQILNNLISNAIKFSDKGTVTCKIKILPNGFLQIIVIDEGIGIQKNIQKNIFKKYYTAETNNKYSHGIGLGLYITKKIIISLNGVIKIDSIINKGTKFTIEIPIPKPEYTHEQIKKYNSINDLPKTTSWLIIDDNPLNNFYLSQFFAQFSNLKTAKNGQEGFDIIEQEHIDIVITDINMPIMTGDELLVKIRNDNKYDSIKVIATSSDNVQIKKLEETNNCYFDGILIKPFNEKDLTEIIFKTLEL